MKMITESEHDLDSISRLHILIVGCGGLGNEVLKNLITFHFKKIDIIDPDSIEKTNLHRQFFFTDKDIGKSKVEVVKEKAEKKFSDVKITSHITKVEYLENKFFEKFDIIIGCLDNIEGRIYVNNIIFNVKKNIIYIDGGVEGFKGNVKIIKKNSDSACINCSLYNYASQKIPICSIINKPKNATECILYAVNTLSNKKKVETENEEKLNDAKEEETKEGKEKEEEKEEEKLKGEAEKEKGLERAEEKKGENKSVREQEDSHELLGSRNNHFIEHVEEKSINRREKNEEQKEDSTLDEYVHRVYLEAKKKAEEFHINDVTYKLTQSVIEKTTPTFSSTLMVIASLITKEVLILAQAMHGVIPTAVATKIQKTSIIVSNNDFVRYTDAGVGDIGSVCNDYADILYVGDIGYYLYYYKMMKLPDCLICNKKYMDLEFKRADKFSTLIDFLAKKYNAKNYSVSSTSCIIYMSTGVMKNMYEHKLHLTFQELMDREEIIEGSGLNAITEKSNDVIFIHFN